MMMKKEINLVTGKVQVTIEDQDAEKLSDAEKLEEESND